VLQLIPNFSKDQINHHNKHKIFVENGCSFEKKQLTQAIESNIQN
jgi:hypothetical protein